MLGAGLARGPVYVFKQDVNTLILSTPRVPFVSWRLVLGSTRHHHRPSSSSPEINPNDCPAMSMTAATGLFRRASSHLARVPRPFLPSVSFDGLFIPDSSVGAAPLPGSSSSGSMELMAVPKKKV